MWDRHTASPVAVGGRRRQARPKLLSLIVVVIDGRKLSGGQARRLFKTQASGDEKVGEQRVAQPVAIASAGALGAVRGEAAQADLAENVEVVHRDEPHIRPPGDTFIGVVGSEEHTSELQSLMRISYAVFCLKKKNNERNIRTNELTNTN